MEIDKERRTLTPSVCTTVSWSASRLSQRFRKNSFVPANENESPPEGSSSSPREEALVMMKLGKLVKIIIFMIGSSSGK